jgi:hypothetical protein
MICLSAAAAASPRKKGKKTEKEGEKSEFLAARR